MERVPILNQVVEDRHFSNAIVQVARHTWWVEESSRLLDVADELLTRPHIPVIGVLKSTGELVGVLEREHLFSLIGKPFGREVFQRSTIREISSPVEPLDSRLNIFTVAQLVSNHSDQVASFIPLVGEGKRFQGIFSIQDLNEYLSRMIQDDIQLAGQLQERILSNSTAVVQDVSVYAWTRSAKGVGGDFYFIKELPGQRIFATLCDVSGKGIAASLIVSLLWGMLSTYDFRRGLKELLIHVNSALVSTFHMEKYLTGIFIMIDTSSKKMLFADMGHSHVVLLRNSKPIPLRAKTMNFPIGIDQDIKPHVVSIILRPGDKILIYTDGITEQTNEAGEEFGEDRLYSLFSSSRDQASLSSLCSEQFDQFRESVPQQDDVSLLSIFFS